MAELADAQDLKSCGTYTPVPVRFRFAAVRELLHFVAVLFFYIHRIFLNSNRNPMRTRKERKNMEKIKLSKKTNLTIEDSFLLFIRKCKVKNLSDLFINRMNKKSHLFLNLMKKKNGG